MIISDEKKWNIKTPYFFGCYIGCIGNVIYWSQYEQLTKLLIVHIIVIINNITWILLYYISITNIFESYIEIEYVYEPIVFIF